MFTAFFHSLLSEGVFFNFFEKNKRPLVAPLIGLAWGGSVVLSGVLDGIVESVWSPHFTRVGDVHGVFVVVVDEGSGHVRGTGSALAVGVLRVSNTDKSVITRLIVNNPKKRTKTAPAASCSVIFVHTSLRSWYMAREINEKSSVCD